MGEEVRPISTGRQKISKVFILHPSNYDEFKQKTQLGPRVSVLQSLGCVPTQTVTQLLFFFNSQLRH